jgi:ribosomal protein S27E
MTNRWNSSLTHPMTSEQLAEANADTENSHWIHVQCQLCGGIECCFNRTQVARLQLCFPCLEFSQGERLDKVNKIIENYNSKIANEIVL